MIDITESVQRYRLALRYIWNSCIWADGDRRNWESFYAFKQLKRPLFATLIESPLDLETGELFGDRFHVVPRDKEFPSLLVNLRPPNDPGGGMFDTSKGALGNGDVSLTLLDMFDWLPLDYIDLRYYETRIREFKAHPEYVGHRALVEVMYCKVLYDEGEISDDTINPAAPGPRV